MKKAFLEFRTLEKNTRFAVDIDHIYLIQDKSSFCLIHLKGIDDPIAITDIYKEVKDQIIKLNENIY
jgi:hypothetical protein